MLQEVLAGILTPERAQSPVDTYLTEEDLFHHRNPQVQAQPGPCPLCMSYGKGTAEPLIGQDLFRASSVSNSLYPHSSSVKRALVVFSLYVEETEAPGG